MRTPFLATMALVYASLITGGASAQSAFDSAVSSDAQDGASPVVQRQPAFAVRVAGSLRVDASWVDQDATPDPIAGGRPGFNLFDERRDVAIIGSATADNGLSYGFTYDVDEDRAALYLANRYGRVDMGNTVTGTDALDVSGVSVMVGRGHWTAGGLKNVNSIFESQSLNLVTFNRPAGITVQNSEIGWEGGGTIRYTTPNYGGLTVSVSYTEEADGTVTQSNSADRMIDGRRGPEDIISAGAQYTSSYGNYTTVVYAGYEKGNLALKGGPVPVVDQGYTIVSVGAKVTGNGIGFGAGWGEESRHTAVQPSTLNWWDVALSFTRGPWAVSGGVAQRLFDSSFFDGQDTAFSVSSNYRIAPGLAFAGGLTHWQSKRDLGAFGTEKTTATTFTLSTLVNF
jgi:predicted porin